MVDIASIKQLRDQTGAGVSDCRWALEEAAGDMEKAASLLKTKGLEKADQKKDRPAKNGLVVSYIHGGGAIGSLVTIACETDFVARTEEFKQLGHEIAMQIAAMNPQTIEELLQQPHIRDGAVTIAELIKQWVGKIGENIQIVKFARFEIGR